MPEILNGDPYSEALEQLEKTTPFIWRSGMKDAFLKDARRNTEFRNGTFRSSRGAQIDIASYMTSILDNGQYLQQRPTNKYQPIFNVRDEGAKKAHALLAEQVLLKTLELDGIVLLPGTKKEFYQVVAKNFLPVDGEDGPAWHLVSDTPIGTLWSSTTINTKKLIDGIGLSKFVDREASEISQMAHRAALRQKAVSMAPIGAKPLEVEKIADKLAAFERRSLTVNKVLPPLSKQTISEEFQRHAELNGANRQAALAAASIQLQALDNLQPVAFEVDRLKLPETIEPHKI